MIEVVSKAPESPVQWKYLYLTDLGFYIWGIQYSVYLTVTKCDISATERLCSQALFTIQAGPYLLYIYIRIGI